MKRLNKAALAVIPALVVCSAPMAWAVSAESGTVGDFYSWTIEENVLTISALDGSFTVTSDGEVLTITGTSYTHGINLNQLDELGAALDFLMDNPASRYVIDVEEVQDLIPVLSTSEMDIVLTENVRYVADDSLLMIPDYSIVTVRSWTLDLDGSGLGYDNNGEARVIGIRGYAGSPAEDYANSNEAFEFFPLEASGQWDEDGVLSWEIKDDILTVRANDGSYILELLPDEIYVSGTAFTGLPEWSWSDENMALFIYLMGLDYEPERIVFDVERIDFDLDTTDVSLITEGHALVLTDKVQSISKYGLYWVEIGTDVYVESRTLELEDSYLGLYLNGVTIADSVTIHGYHNSTAQAYAELYDLPFVAFDEPEETTAPVTTLEVTSSTEASTSTTSSETSATTSNTTTTSATSATSTTAATTTTGAGSGDYGIALLSMPDTGDKNIPAIALTGLAALLGGLFCMKKMK